MNGWKRKIETHWCKEDLKRENLAKNSSVLVLELQQVTATTDNKKTYQFLLQFVISKLYFYVYNINVHVDIIVQYINFQMYTTFGLYWCPNLQ